MTQFQILPKSRIFFFPFEYTVQILTLAFFEGHKFPPLFTSLLIIVIVMYILCIILLT